VLYADLRDPTSDMDWDISIQFLSSSSDVSEFTDVVMSFIETLADTIVPKVKVRSFPHQKHGSIDRSVMICDVLNTCTAAYNSTIWMNTMLRPMDSGKR